MRLAPWANRDRSYSPDPNVVKAVEDWLANRERLMPLLWAFCDELPSGTVRHRLRQLQTDIQSDMPVEEVCQSRTHVATILPLLAVADQPEATGERLSRLVEESRRQSRGASNRLRVIAYPAGIGITALIVMVYLSVMVIPIFAEIFREFQLDLPLSTSVLMAATSAFLSHPLLVFSGLTTLAAIGAGILGLLRSGGPTALTMAFAFITRGNSRSVASMASFLRCLADGLAARLPIPVAIRTAGEVTPDGFLRRRALRLAAEADSVPDQQAGLASLRSSSWFPATAVHLIDSSPGLPTDSTIVPARLYVYSDTLTERIERRFNLTSGFIAQAAIVAVGAVVAGTLFALLTPLVWQVENLS